MCVPVHFNDLFSLHLIPIGRVVPLLSWHWKWRTYSAQAHGGQCFRFVLSRSPRQLWRRKRRKKWLKETSKKSMIKCKRKQKLKFNLCWEQQSSALSSVQVFATKVFIGEACVSGNDGPVWTSCTRSEKKSRRKKQRRWTRANPTVKLMSKITKTSLTGGRKKPGNPNPDSIPYGICWCCVLRVNSNEETEKYRDSCIEWRETAGVVLVITNNVWRNKRYFCTKQISKHM